MCSDCTLPATGTSFRAKQSLHCSLQRQHKSSCTVEQTCKRQNNFSGKFQTLTGNTENRIAHDKLPDMLLALIGNLPSCNTSTAS